ncbi:hypothetical protein SUGI_0719610 [Cryptomeria japonica]|nr:hypothetical protein SUGI_0719610 [Cryptomeria japonica]
MKADEVKLDQDLWLTQIKEGLQFQDEKEEEKDIRVSVFGVPKEPLTVKPEAYIPQCVSIGPYHYLRPQLFEIERYKIAVARRFEKTLTGYCNFESVVEEVKKYNWQIRNCYHKFLEYKEEALAWLMALDGSFVLECLQFYLKQADRTSSEVSSQVKPLGRVVDISRRSETHNAIMRDLMMLENQLPLFLLQKLLEMQLGSQDKAEERLCNLVTLACKDWSPFMLKMRDSSRLLIKERGHILEELYYSIVAAVAMDDTIFKKNDDPNVPLPDSTYLRSALKSLWKALSSLRINLVQLVLALSERALKGRPVQLVTQLSTILGSIFQTLPIKQGGLTTIRFDPTTATLCLPKLRLDSHTEVVIRNLVAFEASAAPGALIFTRYTDFMNGIIDTEEDVRLLRKSGIIYNHLADDGKVASLWNGLGN